MELLDQLRAIADRALEQGDRLATEEATKNALVMPFINALGYNVFDPTEVVPDGGGTRSVLHRQGHPTRAS